MRNKNINKKKTMIPITNPWAYYQPDKIPNITPHNDNEKRGCLSALISFGIAVLLYLLLNRGILEFKEKDIINNDLFFLLMTINIFVFAALTILFMKVGFKITDKINEKKKNQKTNK